MPRPSTATLRMSDGGSVSVTAGPLRELRQLMAKVIRETLIYRLSNGKAFPKNLGFALALEPIAFRNPEQKERTVLPTFPRNVIGNAVDFITVRRKNLRSATSRRRTALACARSSSGP